jgi:hypothetical protein
MKTRRLTLGAFTVAACTPAVSMTDAGADAGYDAGSSKDAGHDAGIDAGLPDAGASDAGCPCFRDGGACKVPPDFPDNLRGTFYQDDICACEPNDFVFCLDETPARCSYWDCSPAKDTDGGLKYDADGGLECLC